MGIAKGQDTQAEYLLQNTPTSVHLVIPSICYVEALTTLEQEEKHNQDFLRRLEIQINEAGREQSSQNSKILVSRLKQSQIRFNKRINEIEQRFYVAFNQLSIKAEMITLNNDIIHESLNKTILEKHIVDKFILKCIIHHARLHSEEIKVFTSSNSKEFGRHEVIEILRDTGVQYFNKTQNFLGWLQSQSN
ncbi:MAG: hypothetical protein KME40_16625 [Komarekiella atlantica HA4396-MV6]|jgi:hypothetical protein|nr:hypothetical protein [Komarekiella atlantica HA4396-MV6]